MKTKKKKGYDVAVFATQLEQSLLSYFGTPEQPYLIEVVSDGNSVFVSYNELCVAHIMVWEMSLDMVSNLSYTLYRCYLAFIVCNEKR